ncbi:TraR/DksA family transcriptional regulator [Saccharopolyspora sp. NPDC002376]
MQDRSTQDASGTQELLARERANALARVESLRRHLAEIGDVSTWSGTDDEHDPEGATLAYERAQVQGLLSDARRDLEALDRAVSRLEKGTYGICERCGKDIAPERLEALPAATTCISCASLRH